MNWHKTVQIAFALSLLSMALAVFVGRKPWFWLVIPVALYLVILVVGTVRISWRYFLPAHIHGPRSKAQVTLTFDDGPDRYTLDVADCLTRHGVAGTFFLIGKKVADRPEVVQSLFAKGHTVGNHGFHHRWSDPLRFNSTISAGIRQTNTLIEDLTGKRPRFYRPPFGITNPRIAKAVTATRMVPIGWDVRSFDTVLGVSDRLSRRLKAQVRNGSIILLHDTGEGMVGFLDAFIPWLQSEGYHIVPLEQLIDDKAYA